jgi:hypothetical protein
MAFAGFPPSEKLLLIRKLIEERMKDGLFARWFVHDLNRVDDVALMGTPEATIVTIVETYHVLREQGVSAASALSAIEEHRSTMSPRASQIGSDLEAYVRKRVRLEHRSGKQLSDRDISRACFLANAFAERHISQERTELNAELKRQLQYANQQFELVAASAEHIPDQPTAASAEHIPDQPTAASEAHKPDLWFISQLPDLDRNPPPKKFKADQGEMYCYYEHPKSIGAVTTGIEPAYDYPQVIVVMRGQAPVLIVRSEQNPSGALFLCSLDERGTHTNWAQISPMSRDDFLTLTDEIVKNIRNETASVAPKEDGVSTHGRAAASGIEYGRDRTQIKNETASVAPKEDGVSTHGRAAASRAEIQPRQGYWNKARRRLGAVIGLIVFLLAGRFYSSVFHAIITGPEPTATEMMSKIVAEVRPTLPKRLDDVTTLVAIDYQANRLRNNFIIEGYIPPNFIQLARNQALKVCSTKTANWVFSRGVVYDYFYWDTKRHYLGMATVSKDDCKGVS